MALAGAFVYAKVAARPHVGGQYAYHPAVALRLRLCAAAGDPHGRHGGRRRDLCALLREVTHLPLAQPVLAALGITLVVGVNRTSVRSGSTVQNGLMVLAIVAIVRLIAAGLVFVAPDAGVAPAAAPARSGSLLLDFGAVMIR